MTTENFCALAPVRCLCGNIMGFSAPDFIVVGTCILRWRTKLECPCGRQRDWRPNHKVVDNGSHPVHAAQP